MTRGDRIRYEIISQESGVKTLYTRFASLGLGVRKHRERPKSSWLEKEQRVLDAPIINDLWLYVRRKSTQDGSTCMWRKSMGFLHKRNSIYKISDLDMKIIHVVDILVQA